MRKLVLMLMRNLSNKVRKIANTLLRVGKLKVSTTIATAISRVKEAIADYNRKRINNVKVYYADI